MLRDRSLVPLSHQHHNALALCVLTDRSLAADSTPDNVTALARRVIDRYEIEMVNHFDLEETVLFPRLKSVQALVEQLTAEHRQLTRMVEELRVEPSAERLHAFADLLRRHVRLEESELFEQAQRTVSRDELDEIGCVLEARAVRVCL